MVACLWNTDRKATFLKVIDALEVVAPPPQEPIVQAADPEPVEPDSDLPADSEPASYDILGPDDYDDAQVLQIIRMWSGFEPEMITDEQLIELLGLDGYLGTDLPDWMMTDLGCRQRGAMSPWTSSCWYYSTYLRISNLTLLVRMPNLTPSVSAVIVKRHKKYVLCVVQSCNVLTQDAPHHILPRENSVTYMKSKAIKYR